MKRILVALAAGFALSATGALAQDVGAINPDMSFTGVDTDRNGLVSFAELNLIYDDYTEEQFRLADSDGDGSLNQIEFESLVIETGSIGFEPAPAPTPVTPPEDALRSLTWSDPTP